MTSVLHTIKGGKMLLIAGILMSFTAVANPFDNVVAALKKGNVEALSRYFDKMVEISLEGESNSYSKSQASVILKDFFASHKAKDFKVIHKGKSGKGSSFGIGNLSTSKGTFRVTFFFRQKGSEVVLQELRFKKSQ